MSNHYRLVGLGNSELLAGLSELVRRSNLLTGQLLAHLVELDERKLHLELGFSSLFAYCVEALGMSEGSAGRRVTAARVCRRFPDVFERVARGELHLCALCALAPHLDPGNAAELFTACRGRTRRQVEELVAARFPRPDVREQIRRMPARSQVQTERIEQGSQSSRADGGCIAAAANPGVTGITTNSAPVPGLTRVLSQEPVLSQGPVLSQELGSLRAGAMVTEARRRARELEPLSVDRFGVHFTADAELRDLIERARVLASHRLPNGDLAGLMKLMAASFVEQEEKRRFGVGAKPRQAKGKGEGKGKGKGKSKGKPASGADPKTPPGGVEPRTIERTTRDLRAVSADKRGRYLPARVRREVHARDRGRCAFVSADGRRCTARTFLEFDHVKPFARFGGAATSNIRLLCQAHNLLHARICFGAMHLAAKIAARKRCGPVVGREVGAL